LPSTSFAPSLSGHPEADLPTMSTPWILHRLYKLDISSARFLRHLHSLLRHDEEEQYLTGLRGSELARLVDFLDEVPTLPSTPCPVINRFCRPSVLYPPMTTFLENVCTNYKPSVPTARHYHPHTSYPMISPESVIIQSPLVELPTYGKVLIWQESLYQVFEGPPER